MKRIFPLIYLVFLSIIVYSQGIQFYEGTWQQAKDEAKRQNKLILVDFYTVWCGPCKMMSNMTFKDKEVGLYANKYYISYKVDCEKGEGPELANYYKIRAYPTIGFFDSNGGLIKKEMGYMPPEDFLEILEQYAKNKPAPKEVTVDLVAIRKPYFDTLARSVIVKKEFMLYKKEAEQAAINKHEFDYYDLKNKIEKDLGDYHVKLLDIYYYFKLKDNVNYVLSVNKLFQTNELNPDQLHLFAWMMYESAKVTTDGLRWINEAIRISKDAQKLQTKAGLQYLYGDFKAGFETAQEAKKIMKNEKSSTESVDLLIKMIEQRK